MSTKVEIKNRWTGELLFSVEVDQPSRLALRDALEIAVASDTDLLGAYLSGAVLSSARLSGARLSGADLRGAILSGSDMRGSDMSDARLSGARLSGADLRGAILSGSDMRGADMSDARLSGAYLRGEDRRLTLVGDRPYLSIGPIGSEHGDLNAYLTDYGVYVRRGCFFGSIDEFRAAVDRKHGGGDHAREYRAAIALIEAHAAIWSPATGGQS